MLTRQKVHAVLRKAGLAKTRTHTTRIKGWHDRVAGYHVSEDDARIYVAHKAPYAAMIGKEEMERRETMALDKYFTALAAFAPEYGAEPWAYGHRCVVLQKTPHTQNSTVKP